MVILRVPPRVAPGAVLVCSFGLHCKAERAVRSFVRLVREFESAVG